MGGSYLDGRQGDRATTWKFLGEKMGEFGAGKTDEKERKIVQLIAPRERDYQRMLYALCNDGTIWVLADGEYNEKLKRQDINWFRMRDIPQDKVSTAPKPKE